MKIKATKLQTVLLLILATGGNSYAHNLYTAAGNLVKDHLHLPPNYPPSVVGKDAAHEKSVGFSRYDRVAAATRAYNCHGRTFANRSAWVNYAEPYIDDAIGDEIPYESISSGDVLVWYDNKTGKTSHTATVLGWRGEEMHVASKYGAYGEYRHALKNTEQVYSKDATWYAYRLYNTRVYKSATSPIEKAKNIASYKAAKLDSAIIAETEYKPWLATILALTQETKKMLGEAKSIEKKIALLINDITDASHYIALPAYNHPDQSQPQDMVQGLQAIKILKQQAQNDAEIRRSVLDRLYILASDLTLSDYARAGVLFTIHEISTNEDNSLISNLVARKVKKSVADNEISDSYESYYLNKLKSKFNP